MKLATLLALCSAALSSAAQTAPMSHPASSSHHVAPAHSTASGGCLSVPTLSPKIPALPTSASCAKALYTITRTPDTHVDYISPLVGPDVRAVLDVQKETFSLLYSEIKPGTGELVRPGTYLTVKYTGWLVDGTKFDSSYDHPGQEPISFPHGQHKVIGGWDTGFEGMRIGGKRRLYIPYQLGYGPNGARTIPSKAELVFDIELVNQSNSAPEPPKPAAPTSTPSTPPSGSGLSGSPGKPVIVPPSGGQAPPPSQTPSTTPH